MPQQYVLVVDDEPAICDMICASLELAGYRTNRSINGSLAHQMILNDMPDIVICDWMMPMLNGIDLVTRLRNDRVTANLPVILVTAKNDEEDRLKGFEAGVDDFICKPISPVELTARVRAVLRRSGSTPADSLQFEDIALDATNKSCRVNQVNIELGPLEFRLISFFVQNPNRVFSRQDILDGVWGVNVYIDDRTVDVHIRRLRRVLATANAEGYIQTVRGRGYRLSQPIDSSF